MFDIQEQLKLLTEEPGVYLMKNKNDKIIYVGKAVSLKNRVRQYFQSSKNHSSSKHLVLLVTILIVLEYQTLKNLLFSL